LVCQASGCNGLSTPAACGRITSLLAGFYLSIQLVAPLILLARPAPRSTDFAWDMFSHALSCSRFDVMARVQGRTWASVRVDLDFVNWAQLTRVLTVPSRLERYAAYLCRKLREEERAPVELRFIAECRDDRTAPTTSLIDAARDYCAAAP
jgi:hypothetical protein